MKTLPHIIVVCALLAQSFLAPSLANACTGITLHPKDGSIIFGRTLEFAMDMKSNIIVVPRGKEYLGTAPGNQPGLRWTTKYGIVGTNAFNMPVTLDGLNEQGLHVGLFYFPGYAKYNAVTPADFGNTLAPWELGVYLLGTCSDVDEAVLAAQKVLVGPAIQKDMGIVPPAHFIVIDASGKCVVLEYIDGALKVHNNPLGVMTNSPSFDWHITNLSNYVNLSISNVPQINLSGKKIPGLGQGSGMLGLPGDFTPPSRFVRAVAFAQSAVPVQSAREGVLQAFHLLNQFDIPHGAAREIENGHEVADYTQWTVVSDLTNRRYYFRTFDNSRIRMIDLKTMDFGGNQIKTISMQGGEQIEDVGKQAK